MRNSIVRIQKIQLQNFKNVENGIVEFKSDPKNELEYDIKAKILGIYGQNGSGKTALVNACNFLRHILNGESLPRDAYNFVNLFSKTATVKVEFYIQTEKEKYIVDYEFEVEKLEDNKVQISREKLSYSKKEEEEWSSKVVIIDYDNSYEETIFKPKYRYNELVDAKSENLINIKVAQKLASEKNMSFIFNEESKKIFIDSFKDNESIQILNTLVYFSRYNFFVIMNNSTGIISMNLLLPFSFRIAENESVSSGSIPVRLSNATIIDKKEFEILNKIIEQMNVVLQKIVPTLLIELHSYGEQYDEKGNLGLKVELLSIKENLKLPLKYESEGIKKIISIMSALIAMYNNKSICMVVDELDSGIYEYLLGEILSVIELGAKGQLIFTSHNLRPLEILNKDSLYFTTTNPQNRYIRFSNVKSNNNLRSMYIRSINLGGQKEDIYNETDNMEIRRAFRLAGEKYNAI